MRRTNLNVSLLLLIAIIVVFLAGVSVMFLGLTSRFDLLKSSGTEERVTSILFVFEYNDKPLASYVTFYYHKTHRVAIFDIPGNVGRIIKKINRVDRIDTVYNSKKFSNYTDEIEALIGIDIQHTMVFELSNLGKTVDMLEGVKILIPSAIAFYNGENSILFPSGWITLDGDKSQRYLIYENEGNENESIEQRHQRFFIGFLKRLGESNSYIKLPQIDKRLSTLARTNMNHKTRIKIYDELAGIDTDRATVQRVIGNYRDVSGQMLLIPHYNGEMIKDAVRQTLIALTRQLDRSVSGKIITVEVLNGTNISGLAGRTAELIRGFGYDVVNVGNTDRNDYEHTQIIDHFNHPEESEIFAEIINCDVIIHEKPEDDFELQTIEYKADFTLILGMDYRGRFK